MFGSQKGDSHVLAAVRAILPDIAAAAETSEKDRSIGRDLGDRLADAGAFRMFIPKARGGEELTPLQCSRVIEAISRADASAGWAAMVATGYNGVLGLFKPEFIDEVTNRSPDVRMRGGGTPKGRIVEVEGGCRISGQWAMASGGFRFDWVAAHAPVFDGDRPRMVGDRPLMRFVALKSDEVRFLDNWNAVGMAATESNDFVVDDVFVPESRIGGSFLDEPWHSNLEFAVHRLPFPMITAGQHAAVSIGCAAGALDDLAQISLSKRPAFRPNQPLIDDPVFSHRFGELLTRVDASRSYCDSLMEDSWELANSGRLATFSDVARLKAMVAKVSLDCIEIVNDAITMGGTTAINNSGNIQKRWRDVRVAAAHIAANRVGFDEVAAGYFGDLVKPEQMAH